MFSTIHSLDFAGDIFQPELQVETISTRLEPLPAIEFSNALRIAFLRFADGGNGLYALACHVSGSFQLCSNIGHLQRIAVQMHVTSVRAGRCLHAYKGSGSHLSPGHTIDGIVDEDDGDVFAAVQVRGWFRQYRYKPGRRLPGK